VACDAPILAATRAQHLDVGHGVTVRTIPTTSGGFLPWRFDVALPRSADARTVVLERVLADGRVDVVLSAPLPSHARRAAVLVTFVDARPVLRVGRIQQVGDSGAARLHGGAVMNPFVLPQDSGGAIVLEYAIPEPSGREPPTLQEVRRSGATEVLRLRFDVRARPPAPDSPRRACCPWRVPTWYASSPTRWPTSATCGARSRIGGGRRFLVRHEGRACRRLRPGRESLVRVGEEARTANPLRVARWSHAP
jgi:hypothetical protein